MSRLSPLPSNLQRSQSAASVAASDATYHSFHDIELREPPATSATVQNEVPLPPHRQDKFEFKPIIRHDSGYESVHSRTRSIASRSSQRRNSTVSTGSSQARPRTRPSIRRAAKSAPNHRLRHSGAQPLHPAQTQQQPSTYYYFPPPEALSGDLDEGEDTQCAGPSYPPPPQTTHYWTSDHTRRLEYAAIDAASQGVKGWVMKHIVPDCFVPKSSRRVGFDDDRGSVRRYRLELDCDESGEKGGKKMGWLLGR
ncbi:hypothetical protein GGR54DRAFT_201573 [Hypoxylon sp. NC1633]|nr:hypothetical protein GGR54DRAFT_201573 [Hypoxylon sp. NC1633]